MSADQTVYMKLYMAKENKIIKSFRIYQKKGSVIINYPDGRQEKMGFAKVIMVF